MKKMTISVNIPQGYIWGLGHQSDHGFLVGFEIGQKYFLPFSNPCHGFFFQAHGPQR